MSGTSLDGVSTALVKVTESPPGAELVAFRVEPYAAAERAQMIDVMARGSARDLALLHVALGERFAGAVLQLLATAGVAPRDLSFVASHGQTVWHEPGRATLQLGDPAVLAERLGVRVVSDFRARDVAAGGQGAPLVPLADVLLFGHPAHGRLLLNLGGIANVTWVARRGEIAGAVAFDTGPGVGVIDAVVRRFTPDAPFDRDGERARRGQPISSVLDQLLADAYFAAPPPKSTGRERFSPAYAEQSDRAGASGGRLRERRRRDGHGADRRGRGPGDHAVDPGGRRGGAGDLGRRRAQSRVGRAARRARASPARGAVRRAVLRWRSEGGSGLCVPRIISRSTNRPGNLPAATGARGPRVLGHVTPA